MSLGDRNFSSLLQSYGITIYMWFVIDRNIFMKHMTIAFDPRFWPKHLLLELEKNLGDQVGGTRAIARLSLGYLLAIQVETTE